MLRNAVEGGEGIGVFEAAERSPRTILLIFWLPLMIWGVTPLIRPFRWSRLFWTYLAPVVPFVIWFDGIVSCLRTYSEEETRELIRGLPGRWETGEERSGMVAISYIIGTADTLARPQHEHP